MKGGCKEVVVSSQLTYALITFATVCRLHCVSSGRKYGDKVIMGIFKCNVLSVARCIVNYGELPRLGWLK